MLEEERENMLSNKQPRMIITVLMIGLMLSGCSGGKNAALTATPTGMVAEPTANVVVNSTGQEATAAPTAEDESTQVPGETPTVEVTPPAAASSTWSIVVDDKQTQEIQGMTIVYTLTMLVENPLGTADNAAGNYTGTGVLHQSMDASQLDNSGVSFSGGFDIVMTADLVDFDLIRYDWAAYEEMGKQYGFQVMAPLKENSFKYVSVASVPMQGSGELNPFGQGAQGESAGLDESASGSGNVIFNITIDPAGQVMVSSPTLPVIFKGELIGGGE